MCAVPPSYSLELEGSVPSYSSEPLYGEQRLEHSPRITRRRMPTGTFTKSNSRVTLFLSGQDDGASSPTYGRNGCIRGEVFVKDIDRKDLVAVTMKLDGIIDLTISEGGTKKSTIVAQSVTLWQINSANAACPEILPLELAIPSKYQDEDRSRPIPPSFEFSSPGVPGLTVKCVYTITVEIAKHRNALAFWKSRTNLVVPLEYCPQTRPHRPILSNDYSFFSTIKPSPEEWHQVTTAMATRTNSGLQPIQCHLFIPSAQIFGITDTIPFHVQLYAPLESLHALTTAKSTADYRNNHTLKEPVGKDPFIRVFLLRQVSVTVYGQKAWRDSVIGEGTLKRLPPLACQPRGYEVLDWDGEVRCADYVKAGGFNVGDLMIRDFIVLALYPPLPSTSPLLQTRHTHPIRLVTDTYADLAGTPEETLV